MVVDFSFSDMLNVVMVNDHSPVTSNIIIPIWLKKLLIEFQVINCLKKTDEYKI